MRRWSIRLALAFGLLLLSLVIARSALSKPLPTGAVGPAAEALADAFLSSVNAAAWEQTGAVRWRMSSHEHLWDRQRSLARVRTGDTEVLVELGSAQGRAFRDGEELQGRAARKAIEKGYAAWVNDAFWLAAPTKLRDDGTTRALVNTEQGDALLVSYASGGLTPGDAYLWRVDADSRPSAWSLWVSVIPIGGVTISWEGWQPLSTGAMVSTRHQVVGHPKLAFSLEDVAGAATLAELEPGPDPFAALNP